MQEEAERKRGREKKREGRRRDKVIEKSVR